MSTVDFQSRFKTVRQDLPSSTSPFQLACNTYTSIIPRQSATPPIIFTHANGFHKEIWEPVISRMSPRWTSGPMYAFDCRNQGDSAILNKDILENTFDWYSYAHDILKIVDTFGLKKPIGVGHSFGASAFILAENIRPGTFSAIVAVDPTNFPRTIYINLPLEDHPMGQLTLKRRDSWKSKEEAKANLLQKKFFKAWHPEALDIYVEYGTVNVVNADGSTGVTLKCPKFQEAITFAHIGTALHDSFEGMAKLDIPVHLLVGETSDINQPETVQMKLEMLKHGHLDVVKGAGHLLTLEKPQESADLISAFLDRALTHRAEQLPQAKL
ncbi:hypothetical protein CPC16_009365 [Podila verticillata]|nr:hypothetical protein BGZ59_000799 [Podila verticillata]KAF9382398.1 hypothetical protein CPC16_009365 [Podila verticillata]KFH69939.1 hypothetical protein MVEG_04743 [Podila verticillata NRRL 6337]